MATAFLSAKPPEKKAWMSNGSPRCSSRPDETFGVKFRVDVERRIEGARKVGAHKTSMLQDLERGRPMEIDPLVTVVQEMGRLTKIPTPALDSVLAMVTQRARIAGLYDGVSAPADPRALAVA